MCSKPLLWPLTYFFLFRLSGHMINWILNVAVRRMSPQRCPRPQQLWICYVIWQRGIKVANGIKVTSSLSLIYGDFLGYPVGPNVITKGKRGRQENQRDGSLRRTWSHSAGFEEVKKCRQALEARKGKKMEFSLEHPEWTQFCQRLWF